MAPANSRKPDPMIACAALACCSRRPARRHRAKLVMRAAILLVCASALFAQPFQEVAFPGASALDAEINRAIERQLIPGAVVLIGHGGAVVYRNADGSKALV